MLEALTTRLGQVTRLVRDGRDLDHRQTLEAGARGIDRDQVIAAILRAAARDLMAVIDLPG